MNDNKRRRKRKESAAIPINEVGDGDGENNDHNQIDVEKQSGVKTKELKEIITSLILLEEQEKRDQEEFEKEEKEEKLFFDTNHEKRAREMLDYYSQLQEYHKESDLKDGARKRKGRANSVMAATTLTAAAADAVEHDNKNDNYGGDHGEKGAKGAPQRRLWVKNRLIK